MKNSGRSPVLYSFPSKCIYSREIIDADFLEIREKKAEKSTRGERFDRIYICDTLSFCKISKEDFGGEVPEDE